MTKVTQYINNLSRSVKYSAVDVVKKQAPAITEMATMNNELFKEINYSFRNRRQLILRTGKLIRDSKLYEAVDETRKSIFEDLKTGNFYNKERAEKITKKALGFEDDINMDAIGEGFDFDFSDNDSMDLSDGEALMVDTIEQTSRSSASMISTAVAKSSDYIVESNKAIARMNYIQNIELFTGLNKSIGSLNENLINSARAIADTLTTHGNNSKTFYEESTKYNRENNALLKELVEMERNRYQKEQIQERKSTRYDDIVGSEGGIDFKSYLNQVLKNASNKVSGISSLNNAFGEDSNTLLTMAAHPLKFITDTVANKLIGETVKTSISNLDKSISGAFATLLSRFNLMSRSDNSVVRTIGELFGIDNRMKKEIDTSRYNKGAVQWDGKSKRALEYVLPTYMSKILSVLSGQPETVYDYDSGKFKTMSSLRTEFKNIKKSAVDSSTSDVRSEFEEMLKYIRPNNLYDQNNLKEDMDNFFKFFFNSGVMFDHKNKDYSFYRDMGMNLNDYNNFEVFKGLFKSMSRNKQMKFNSDILNGRASHNDMMENLEKDGSIYSSLFSNSDMMKTVDLDKNGKVSKQYGIAGYLTNTKDEMGKNVFWYLRNIYESLATGIITYNLNGSSGSSKNKNLINSILKRNPKVTNDNTVSYIDPQESYENNKENYFNRNKDAVSLESLIDGDDRDIAKAVEAHISYVKEQQKIRDGAKSSKKKNFIDKLLEAGDLSGKIGFVSEKIKQFTTKPQEIIASAINLADLRLYEVLYGTKKETYKGKEVHGVIDMLVVDMQDTFTRLNTWLDETVLQPIKDKLDKHGGFKGMFNSALEKLGIDPENNMFTRAKEYFFGDGGIFQEVKENVKEDFKSITGYIKDSFKSVYSEIDDMLHIRSRARSLKDRMADKFSVPEELAPDEHKAAIDLVKNMPHYDKGSKYINKTQVALIHKGEAVLTEEERKEYERLKKIKDNLRSARGDGSFGREYMYSKKINGVRLTEDNIEDPESLIYRMNVEFRSIVSSVKKSLFGTTNLIEHDKKLEQAKEDISKNFKQYFPKLASGGVLGGAGAFLFGVNPLLGASVGAAVSLVTRSNELQDYLFGERDEDGKFQGGALLGKKTMDVIQTYVPDMAKYGITGAITSLIPFIPGGPIAGLMVGSGIGFLKHNQEFSKAIFGDEFKVKDAIDTIKKKLPKIGIGAIAGTMLGPFGLVGNLMAGSAIGFISDSDKFKELMYGTEDKDGVMQGGILPSIREAVVKPMSQFFTGAKDNVLTFLSEEIRKPLKMAFKPFVREFKHIGKSIVERIGSGVDWVFEKMVGQPTKDFLEQKLFKPIAGFVGKLGKGALGLAKGLVTAPINIFGAAGNSLAMHQIKRDGLQGIDQEELLYRFQKSPVKLIKAMQKGGVFKNMSYDEIDIFIDKLKTESEQEKIKKEQAKQNRQKDKVSTTKNDTDNQYNAPNSIEIDSNNELKKINETLEKISSATTQIGDNQTSPEKQTMETEFGVLRYDMDSSGETRVIKDNVYKKVMESRKVESSTDFLARFNPDGKADEKKDSWLSKLLNSKMLTLGLPLLALLLKFLMKNGTSRTDANGEYVENWNLDEALGNVGRNAIKKLSKIGTAVSNTVKKITSGIDNMVSSAKKFGTGVSDIFDTAKNIGKETADNVIKETVEETGKEVTEKIAKETAEKVAKDLAADKTAKEVAEKAAQEAAEKIAKQTASSMRKQSDEVAKGVVNVSTKVAGEAIPPSNVVKSTNGIIDEFIKFANTTLGKILDDVASFCAKKGLKISSEIPSILSKLKKLLDPKLLLTQTSKITKGMLNVATTILSDPVFMAWGALTGGSKTETANLFRVSQEYVTWTMRIIAGSLKALLNFSYMFVVDILNEVSSIVFGYDFIYEIAMIIYDKVSSDNKYAKLLEGQEQFKTDYDQYVLDNELEDFSYDAYNDMVNKSTFEQTKENAKNALNGTRPVHGREKGVNPNTPLFKKKTTTTKAPITWKTTNYSNPALAFTGGLTKPSNTSTSKGSYTGYTDQAYGKEPFGQGGETVPLETAIKHYSQKDSRWANVSYNNATDTIKQTMADSGCAPMSAAIIESAYTGASADPLSIAKYAIDKGYKDPNGGTRIGFFNDYLSSKGINVGETNKDINNITSLLKENKPVILMGSSDKKGKTPFGHTPHYVVATGIDSKGNIIVNDPDEQQGGKTYNINDTLAATSRVIKTSINNKGVASANPHNEPTPIKISATKAYELMSEMLDLSKNVIYDLFGIERTDDLTDILSNSLEYDSETGLVDMSKVSKNDVIVRIDNFFKKSSKLKGYGKYYYDGYKKYKFDPFLAAAITMQETGGTSNLLVNYNNPGGLMDPKYNWQKAQTFNSLSQGIDAMIKNLSGYESKYNARTIEEIGAVYCPVGAKNDPNNLNKFWVTNVTKFYTQLTQGLQTASSSVYGGAKSLNEFFINKGMKVTSEYGTRKDPFGSGSTVFHKGVDFAHSAGYPLPSPIQGKVIKNYKSSSFGNTVSLQDKNGAMHTFAHMQSKSPLSIGKSVNVGDVVGKMGSTGDSTGPHLHYQINKNSDFTSQTVDPNQYLSQMMSGKGKDEITTTKKSKSSKNHYNYSSSTIDDSIDKNKGGAQEKINTVNDTTIKTLVELLLRVVENTNNLSLVVKLLSEGLKVDIPEKLLKSLSSGGKPGKANINAIIGDSVKNNGNMSNDALIRSLEMIAAE